MRLLDTCPERAYYGYFHVQKANEELAIDCLLISDELFRSSDIVTRKKYVALVESVRERGGVVYTFSTMHVSGQQLQQVGGIAAILRYPLPVSRLGGGGVGGDIRFPPCLLHCGNRKIPSDPILFALLLLGFG